MWVIENLWLLVNQLYLQGQTPSDEYPLEFDSIDLSAMPPSFVSIGDAEILLDQTLALADKLKSRGVADFP